MQIFKKEIQKYTYAVIPLAAAFLWNAVVYWGTMALCKNWHHYDFTSELDRMIPFVPGFVYIYFGCYLFWIVNYLLSAGRGKTFFYRYLTADLAARSICLIVFILLPTTNTRPEVTGSGLAAGLVRWLYQADQPANLFPSIHCLNSWFCYIAVRGREDIPSWYRRFSLLMALAVGASTVFIKQHYLVDVAAGFLLAEAAWQWSLRVKCYESVRKFFEKLNGKII